MRYAFKPRMLLAGAAVLAALAGFTATAVPASALTGVVAANARAASAATTSSAHAVTAQLDAVGGDSYSFGSGETARHVWETWVPASGEGATTYSFQGFIDSSVGCNGNIGIEFSYSYNTQDLHSGQYLAIGASAVLSDGRTLFLGDYKVTDHSPWPGGRFQDLPVHSFFDDSSPVPYVKKLEVHTFISDGGAIGFPEHSATATVSNGFTKCKIVPVRKDAERVSTAKLRSPLVAS